jgi:hypothetical protein
MLPPQNRFQNEKKYVTNKLNQCLPLHENKTLAIISLRQGFQF